MNPLTIIIVGLSGIVAQVVLLREFLVNFSGNELTLGVLLANWVAAEAAGAWVAGRFIDKAKSKNSPFFITQVSFALLLPLTIYFARLFKVIMGVPLGEGVGLPLILFGSFLIIFPISALHGALFSIVCKMYAQEKTPAGRAIAGGYLWETIGTIAGGLVLTYLFIPFLNSFQAATLVSLANIAVCFLLFGKLREAKVPSPALLLLICAGIFQLILLFNSRLIHQGSLALQWKNVSLLDYRNSVYGNIAVGAKEGQYTFFYNGIPMIVAPHPDQTYTEEFAHLPLLSHPDPKNVLIISGGAGGVIHEILKHPVEKIDYVEPDPALIAMLKKYPTDLTKEELEDPRVNVINLDGRYFLRTTANSYDVILIGISQPQDLSLNRFLTEEFFGMAARRLNPDGIIAFTLPGSLSYLGPSLRDLNSCIFGGLKKTFRYQRIIPGDYNLYLASKGDGIINSGAAQLSEKIKKQGIELKVLVPAYLEYRFDPRWLRWFTESSRGATPKVNKDLLPIGVFEMLLLWNKQFSPLWARVLEFSQRITLKGITLFILLCTALLYFVSHRYPSGKKMAVTYGIVTTGFFGMLVTLVLLFAFQIYLGYLYHWMGLLISVFMAGSAAGSYLISRGKLGPRPALHLFAMLESGMILFVLLLAYVIGSAVFSSVFSVAVFVLLFCIAGFFVGAQFVLASRIYLQDKEALGKTAGMLYAADLMGGWVAGIIGGVLLIPVLGVLQACMVIALLKMSSLYLFSSGIK